MKNYCPNYCEICKKHKEICYYSDENLSFKCQVCKQIKSPHDVYEYKGFKSCSDCFDELCGRVDYEIKEANRIIESSVESQRNGEFINNHKKYDIHDVASDGLPIIKVKEPHVAKEIRASNTTDVVFIGQGGSIECIKTMYGILGKDEKSPNIHCLDTVDNDVINEIKKLNLKKTRVVAISKSMTTMETTTKRFGTVESPISRAAVQSNTIRKSMRDASIRRFGYSPGSGWIVTRNLDRIRTSPCSCLACRVPGRRWSSRSSRATSTYSGAVSSRIPPT